MKQMSTLTFPDGTTYEVVDLEARSKTVNVVDPMKATTAGQVADALATKNAIDEQNKNLSNLGGFTPIIDNTGKITGSDS